MGKREEEVSVLGDKSIESQERGRDGGRRSRRRPREDRAPRIDPTSGAAQLALINAGERVQEQRFCS